MVALYHVVSAIFTIEVGDFYQILLYVYVGLQTM